MLVLNGHLLEVCLLHRSLLWSVENISRKILYTVYITMPDHVIQKVFNLTSLLTAGGRGGGGEWAGVGGGHIKLFTREAKTIIFVIILIYNTEHLD